MAYDSDTTLDEFHAEMLSLGVSKPNSPRTDHPFTLVRPEWISNEFSADSELRPRFNLAMEHLAKINEQPIKPGTFYYLFQSTEREYLTPNAALANLKQLKPVYFLRAQTNNDLNIAIDHKQTSLVHNLAEMYDWYLSD